MVLHCLCSCSVACQLAIRIGSSYSSIEAAVSKVTGQGLGEDKGGLEGVKPDPTAETVTSPSGVNEFGLDEILGHAF